MMTNLKGFGMKRSWPNFKALSRHSPGGAEKKTNNLNQDSRSPEPKFELGSSQIRRNTTRPRSSVENVG
jgi:hypothetical protein